MTNRISLFPKLFLLNCYLTDVLKHSIDRSHMTLQNLALCLMFVHNVILNMGLIAPNYECISDYFIWRTCPYNFKILNRSIQAFCKQHFFYVLFYSQPTKTRQHLWLSHSNPFFYTCFILVVIFIGTQVDTKVYCIKLLLKI